MIRKSTLHISWMACASHFPNPVVAPTVAKINTLSGRGSPTGSDLRSLSNRCPLSSRWSPCMRQLFHSRQGSASRTRPFYGLYLIEAPLPTVLVLECRLALPRLAGLHHRQASDSLLEISPSRKAQVGQPGPQWSFSNDLKSDDQMQRNHEGHRSRFDVSNLGSPFTSGHRPSALHSIFNHPYPRGAMQRLRLSPEDTAEA